MARCAIATLALLLAGCGAPSSDGVEGRPVISAEQARAELRAAAEAYQMAASAKDAETVVSMYDETAVMVPPNAPLVNGLAEVREYRFGFIETPGVELDFELIRLEVSEAGDLGWTLAIGQITINREDGPPGRDVVRDYHTWRRQADGSWKIVVDAWNSGVPVGG